MVPLLAAFAIWGFIGAAGLVSAFTDCQDFWRHGKRWIFYSLGLFGLIGAVLYLGALLTQQAGLDVRLGTRSVPGPWLAVGASGGAGQVLARAEIRRKPALGGTPPPAGEKESAYALGQRVIFARTYIRLLNKMDEKHLPHRLARGISAVYTAAELKQELQGWGNRLPHEESKRFVKMMAKLFTTGATDQEKVDTMTNFLIDHDLDTAKRFAEDRAKAIVDRRTM